jgi:hypothetical protein
LLRYFPFGLSLDERLRQIGLAGAFGDATLKTLFVVPSCCCGYVLVDGFFLPRRHNGGRFFAPKALHSKAQAFAGIPSHPEKHSVGNTP